MQSSVTLRAGIVGTGFAARFHFDTLQRVHGVDRRVAGVYSPTAENRSRFASERGIAGFGSLEDLIEASDVVQDPRDF